MILLTRLAAALTLSGPGQTLTATLAAEDGTPLATFYAADNQDPAALSWCRDENSQPERITVTLPPLSLPPGRYRLTADWSGQPMTQWIEGAPAGKPVTVEAPATAVGTAAWSMGDGGFAWAEAGEPLHLSSGRWQVAAVGTARPAVAQLVAPTPSVRLTEGLLPLHRAPRSLGLLSLLAAPTIVLLAAAVSGLIALRRQRGAGWMLLAALAVATLGIAAVLPHTDSALLSTGGPIRDPEGSVALLATMLHAGPLSDVGAAFSYPEGTSWLVLGPTWLGYFPAALVAGLSDPVTGHNLGVGVGLGALALAVMLLARSHRVGLPLAIAAGAAAALCPAVIDTVDAITLDRATLYLTPLALLCLDRAARTPGWRWPTAAGVAVAAGVYGQVYYGIFFATVAPLLGGLRLLAGVPDGRWRGLQRLLLAGAVAAILAAPGLHVLKAGTTGRYDDTAPLADWRHPITTAQAERALSRTDSALPMATAEERLLTAARLAEDGTEVLRPDGLPGIGLWWLLALSALLLARDRRRTAVAIVDVGILLILSLGPVLKIDGRWSGTLLPHYLLFLTVPGFDQLKNVHRFALLAATLSPIPIVLAIDGLGRRLPRGRRLIEGTLAAALTLSLFRLDNSQTPRLSRPPQAIPVPVSAILSELSPAPAIALPLSHPTPRTIALTATRHGMPLVNPPPFEVSRQALSPWAEDNALLNALAIRSGNPRISRTLPAEDLTPDLAALWDAGVRYVLLFEALMPHSAEVSAWLDARLEVAGEDEVVRAWHLRPAAAPAP